MAEPQFIRFDDLRTFELAAGVSGRPLFGEGAMLNLIEFEPGSVVPLHSHPHEQLGIVLRGMQALVVDGVGARAGAARGVRSARRRRALGLLRARWRARAGHLLPRSRGLPRALGRRGMKPAVVDGQWQVPERFNFGRDVVEALALENRDLPAITFVDSVGAIQRLTFHDVALGAARWSGLLSDWGLERGDRLLVLAGKTPEWHMVLLGALRLGLVAIPCSELLRARDIAFRVRHSGATVVVAERSCEAELERDGESARRLAAGALPRRAPLT